MVGHYFVWDSLEQSYIFFTLVTGTTKISDKFTLVSFVISLSGVTSIDHWAEYASSTCFESEILSASLNNMVFTFQK